MKTNDDKQFDDGGPAFPFKCQGETTAPEIYYGASLRDVFAWQALSGIVKAGDPGRKDLDPYADALLAYHYADAMLRARRTP